MKERERSGINPACISSQVWEITHFDELIMVSEAILRGSDLAQII